MTDAAGAGLGPILPGPAPVPGAPLVGVITGPVTAGEERWRMWGGWSLAAAVIVSMAVWATRVSAVIPASVGFVIAAAVLSAGLIRFDLRGRRTLTHRFGVRALTGQTTSCRMPGRLIGGPLRAGAMVQV